MTDISRCWNDVHREAARLKPLHLRQLFAIDPNRFDRLSVRLDDILVDHSKEKLDPRAMASLLALARAAGVEARREEMFRGEEVNVTEHRAALHVALRGDGDDDIGTAAGNIMAEVLRMRERMLGFAGDLRHGRVASASGEPFSDVVNIGIGGSHLGPAMATRALASFHDGPRLHFVSNVDGADIADTLKPLDPRKTLVIVASKTFDTLETMTNARSARAWLGDTAGQHMAAVTSHPAAARDVAIDDERIFGFGDWVGGRYSLWSSIGLPLAIAVGDDRFRSFLEGGRMMDRHFRTAPLEGNLPVILAVIGIWRRNAMCWPTRALIPYDQRLRLFPAYIQQLEMESNGKGVGRDGSLLARPSAPVVWGGCGTASQHSFFQLLHQGTDTVPVDFLLAARPHEAPEDHHAILAANAVAQAAALAFGRTAADVKAAMATSGASEDDIRSLVPHRTLPGDRPSTTILYRRLDAMTLGRLVALFEHKVFVEGAIWNLNPFDQWGVEFAKDLAQQVLPMLQDGAGTEELDSSSRGLIAHLDQLGGN